MLVPPRIHLHGNGRGSARQQQHCPTCVGTDRPVLQNVSRAAMLHNQADVLEISAESVILLYLPSHEQQRRQP